MIEKASLSNSFGYFGDVRKIGNCTGAGEVFFIERGFFRSGVTMEDIISGDGKVPVERERMTKLQMVGEIEEGMSLSRLFGIGSRSQ